jgi:hypothetical protein
MEILMLEHRLRFEGGSDSQYRFFLTHDDFARYADLLLAVLKDNKLNFQ